MGKTLFVPLTSFARIMARYGGDSRGRNLAQKSMAVSENN
jgi:hypothetical protein